MISLKNTLILGLMLSTAITTTDAVAAQTNINWKSLDLKNVYKLQQDKHGIYKKVYSEKTKSYKKVHISNFNIISATSLRFVDEGLENIEITFKTEYQ